MFQNCISRDVLLVARRTRQIPVFGLCRYTLIGMGFLEFLAIVVILIAGHLNVAYLEAAESIETNLLDILLLSWALSLAGTFHALFRLAALLRLRPSGQNATPHTILEAFCTGIALL